MITAKQAIQSALRFLTEILEDVEPSSIRVEELERNRAEDAWCVTLSYYPTPDPPLVIAPDRSYKSFEVDSASGEVRSMKIRELQ